MRELVRGYWAMIRLAFAADPWRASFIFIAGPVAGAAGAIEAYWLSQLTDGVIAADVARVVVMAAVIGATGALSMGFSLAGFTVRMRLRERIDGLVDERLIELTAGIPTIEHFERADYLDRIELLRTNRAELGHVLEALGQNAQNLVYFGWVVALLATVHPALLLLPLFGIPSTAISGRAQRRVNEVERETAELSRRALHLFDLGTDAAAGKELRAFGLADTFRDRFRRLWTERDHARDGISRRMAWRRAGGWGLFAVGFVLSLLLVAREAVEGRATAGEVLMALHLSSQVNQGVSQVAFAVQWLMKSSETIRRFTWLVDHAAQQRTEPVDPAPAPERLTTGIRLDGVTFAYPGADGPAVLRDVDLLLPAGSTVAIVGENGAGKTTLVKLLTRMYDPTAGRITVDDIDLTRIPIAEWRARTAAGFQDFAHFELLAREVVGIGDLPQVADARAAGAALARAGAEAVIDDLQDGLETMLGASFGGSELSGGQWQKLALGRAMMRTYPLLLVLDEPTASLDADAEHALFERYATVARDVGRRIGTVTILVSHRFSTVGMADLIVVIDGSGIRECGSHAELMAHGDLYAELYELQARAYR